MDTNRQEDPLSSAVTQDDETQMTDDDQTQMSESDMTHNIRGRLRIRSSSESEPADEHMGESSQQFDDLDPHLVNLGQEDTQETDSCSVEAESQIFNNPVTTACEKTRHSRIRVFISDSDSDDPESGDDMSQAQSSQSEEFSDPTQPPVNQSFNMSKASGSKAPDVTELGQDPGASQSQRDQRQENRKQKQKSFLNAFHRTQKSRKKIKENKANGKVPSPIKKRKSQKNASWVWKFAEKIIVDGETKTKCSICGHIIGLYKGSSTSNIIRHIDNNHKAQSN